MSLSPLLVPLLQVDEREDFFRVLVFDAPGEGVGFAKVAEEFTQVFAGRFLAHAFSRNDAAAKIWLLFISRTAKTCKIQPRDAGLRPRSAAFFIPFCPILLLKKPNCMELQNLYPAPPPNVPPGIAEPAPSFRTGVRNVIGAIAAFILVYLLMVVLAFVLLWLCYKIGIFIITEVGGFWPLLLGCGLILMGGLVVYFLLKFLFASSGESGEPGIQISEGDEPRLFEFIRRVATEVGTHFPKKIYLLPDVNASVFYSSSFWSLFFPTRKNLNIGLGLVNSLNISELKAVLAHEFGHFSQKSMRLGTYVYFVNQVIFNMLYRNDGWAKTAGGIAGIHGLLGAMVQLAVYIVQGIQWVLRGMYAIVNRQYLSLSREMEFHADTIAASVSGSNNMVQALRQVELGSATFQRALEKCNELLAADNAPLNFYAGQRAAATHFALVNELPLQQGVPVVSQAFVESQRRQRVVFKDQWASHPTLSEREANLHDLALEAPVSETSAWAVFNDPAHWQRALTDYLYREVEKEVNNVEDEEFAKSILDESSNRQLPKMYRGYFDGHIVAEANLAEIERDARPVVAPPTAIAELFGENPDRKIGLLQNDIETLNAIADGRIDTNTFDFDGRKYGKDQASDIREQLENEKTVLEAERDRTDRESVRTFYGHVLAKHPARATQFLEAWRSLYEARRWKLEFDPSANAIFVTIHFLRLNNFNVAVDVAQQFRELHTYHEPGLREFFQKMPDLGVFSSELQTKIKETFLGDAIAYHHYDQPHQTNLEKLQSLIVEISQALGELYFNRLKTALTLQEEMIKD